MVDYYALISPTLEPLANSSPEDRRIVYDRMVEMLDQKLRSADPPRSEKEILRERIDLEAAIRRIERQFLSRPRSVEPKPSTPPTLSPSSNVAGVVQPNSTPVAAAPETALSQPETPPAEPTPPEPITAGPVEQTSATQAESAPEALAEPIAASTPEATIEPERETEAAESPPALATAKTAPPITEQNATPDIVLADAPAAFVAKDLEPEPEAVRVEAAVQPIPETQPAPDALHVPEAEAAPLSPEPIAPVARTLQLAPSEAPIAEPAREPVASYKPPSMPDLEPVPVPVIAEAVRSPPILRVPQPAPERKLVKILLRLGVVALVVIALAGAVMGIGVMLERRAAEAERQQAAAQADTAPAPVDEKIADRLPSAQEGTDKNPSSAGTGASSGQPGDTSATIDADAAGPPQNPLVQQAFILAEPVSGTSEPVRYEGRVTWKLETLKSAITNTSDIGARAIIDIPDAGFALSLVFRQNRDPKAAFAHVIEANFSLSENNLNGKIRDINLPELRLSETVRGAPLLGIPVPVTDKMFLIGLNALPADIERNLDLLRTRNWFLIPIRYANGKRTVLLFEKGKAGERIMEDAIGTWK